MDSLTRDELEKHHQWAIDAMDSALSKLRSVKPADRTPQIMNHIRYYKHARQAFRWSKSFIGKKLKVKDNGIARQVHESE